MKGDFTYMYICIMYIYIHTHIYICVYNYCKINKVFNVQKGSCGHEFVATTLGT